MNASIAIIQFPGSNTERETLMACHRAGLNPVEFLWNEAPEKLSEFDGFVIVRGFSYEDRSRSGVIASLDPIMKQVRIEADFGKPVLGICNGAQILVESGLVPGLKDHRLGIALTDNKRIKNGNVIGVGYYNTWANLQMSVPYARCAFTHHLKKDLSNLNEILVKKNDYSEFVLLLNNDTEVDPTILSSFIQAKEMYGDNNLYGGKIFYQETPNLIWYAGGNVNLKRAKISHRGIRQNDSAEFSKPLQTDYITGCCLFTSMEVINQLNGFDERFNMYGEDVDLCLRAKEEGIQCYYWPEAKLWHHVSASLGGAYSIHKLRKKMVGYFKIILKRHSYKI